MAWNGMRLWDTFVFTSSDPADWVEENSNGEDDEEDDDDDNGAVKRRSRHVSFLLRYARSTYSHHGYRLASDPDNVESGRDGWTEAHHDGGANPIIATVPAADGMFLTASLTGGGG